MSKATIFDMIHNRRLWTIPGILLRINPDIEKIPEVKRQFYLVNNRTINGITFKTDAIRIIKNNIKEGNNLHL